MRHLLTTLLVLSFSSLLLSQSIIINTKTSAPIKSNLSEIDSITFSSTKVPTGASDSLVVLWVSSDKEVAEKACLMYAHYAQTSKGFKQVVLIVWGPSTKLLSQDTALQTKVKNMIADGVKVQACKACTDEYKVSDALITLGIEVRYMGAVLTDYIKSGLKILTY